MARVERSDRAAPAPANGAPLPIWRVKVSRRFFYAVVPVETSSNAYEKSFSAPVLLVEAGLSPSRPRDSATAENLVTLDCQDEIYTETNATRPQAGFARAGAPAPAPTRQILPTELGMNCV
jgi:hypothetical protein